MKTSKSKSTAKVAVHRSFANEKVSFTLTKDFLGDTLYKVKFQNGETTTLSTRRFNELYEIVKS